MSVVTVRPDSTITAIGVSASPSGTVHGVLADDSDSTYASVPGGPGTANLLTVGFADPSIPAGGSIVSVTVRMRAPTGFSYSQMALQSGSKTLSIPSFIARTSGASTYTVITASTWDDGSAITATQLGSAQFTVHGYEAGVEQLKLYEVYLDVNYTSSPTVSADAPSGTITTTNTPQVQWTPSLDSLAGPQTAYRVKIFDSATYSAGGFDPETDTAYTSIDPGTGAATSWTPAAGLVNDSYRAYVWVAQTVGGVLVWSDPDYTAFTIGDPPVPGTPTLTATGDNTNARIEIVVNDTAGTGSTDALEIQRSTDSGTTWEPLRDVDQADGLIFVTDTTSYDYEASNGQTITYRARAAHDVGGGLYSYSDWSTTDTGSWTDATNWWLKSPTVPSLNTTVTIHSFQAYARTARQGLFQPLGASAPIAAIDTRASATGSIVLWIDTTDDQATIDAIVDGGGGLLLQPPDGVYESDRYIVLGDLQRSRLVDKGFVETVLDTYTWTEVQAPAGNVTEWPA